MFIKLGQMLQQPNTKYQENIQREIYFSLKSCGANETGSKDLCSKLHLRVRKYSIKPSARVFWILKLYHLCHRADSKKESIQLTHTVNHFRLEGTHIISTHIPLVKIHSRHMSPTRCNRLGNEVLYCSKEDEVILIDE